MRHSSDNELSNNQKDWRSIENVNNFPLIFFDEFIQGWTKIVSEKQFKDKNMWLGA